VGRVVSSLVAAIVKSSCAVATSCTNFKDTNDEETNHNPETPDVAGSGKQNERDDTEIFEGIDI